MRKLIFAINITLDGCCDHTRVEPGEEVFDYHTRLLHEVDVLVYGRKTYELMVPFWPDRARSPSGETRAMSDFAQAFDSVGQIVVFSRTLQGPDGGKTRIVRGDLRDEVPKLKQGHGKDLLTGGVSFPAQLMALGLIDEYRVLVHPVLAGSGRRLLQDVNLPERRNLKLIDSKPFPSGHVALRYLNA